MEAVINLVILVFVIIWALRIETGINKVNETLEKIEQGLRSQKKENK